MINLSNDQANDLKRTVLDFLKNGHDLDETKYRLQLQCKRLKTSSKELFESITLAPDTNDELVIKILSWLKIKKPSEAYTKLLGQSPNLYKLLTHLSHDGNHHVRTFLELVDNTQPPRRWALIFLFGAVLSAGLGTLFHFKKTQIEALANWAVRTYPTAISWLGKTFSLLRNFALLGIIYNSLSLVWNWYKTFTNGTTPTLHKLGRLFAKTLAASLTISAYALVYFAEGMMAFPAAFLFVLGSSIDLFKGLFTLYKNRQALKALLKPDHSNQTPADLAEYARAVNLRARSSRAVWVKLGAALLTTLAISIWAFFPPSLVITISCMSFNILVSLTKKALLATLHEGYARELQDQTKKIAMLPPQDREYTYTQALEPANQPLPDTAQERPQQQREESVKEIATIAAKEAVKETLAALGINSTTMVLQTLHARGEDAAARQPAHAHLTRSTSMPNITFELTRSHRASPLSTSDDSANDADVDEASDNADTAVTP